MRHEYGFVNLIYGFDIFVWRITVQKNHYPPGNHHTSLAGTQAIIEGSGHPVVTSG